MKIRPTNIYITYKDELYVRPNFLPLFFYKGNRTVKA